MFAVLVMAFAASGFARSGIEVEMGFGMGRSLQKNYGILSPRLQYNINDDWSVGAVMKFDVRKDHANLYYSYGGFVQYRFLRRGSFALFVDAAGSYNHQLETVLVDDWRPDSGAPEGLRNFAEVGLTPGVSYSIADTGFSLKLRYLFLGYNSAPSWYKSLGCLGDGDFILDAGLRRLSLSVAYAF